MAIDEPVPENPKQEFVEPSQTEKADPVSPKILVTRIKADNPYRCLRDCIEVAFNAETILTFCQTYFNPLYRGIRETESFESTVRKLLDHCDSHGAYELFWKSLRQERKSHYDTYYPKWQAAVQERGTSGAEDDSMFFERESVTRVSTPDASGQSPLNKDAGELARWFFHDLKSSEQSLLLTVTLFEGMSRQKLIHISAALEALLAIQR
jgi:hypothetical protein